MKNNSEKLKNTTTKDISLKDAGFWLRAIAFLIDHSVITFITFLLTYFLSLLGLAGAFGASLASIDISSGAGLMLAIFSVITMFIGVIIVYLSTGWLYYALMESSSYKATLGKLALGLVVLDSENKKITFNRATIRYSAKILSYITGFIGFAMAGFTERKQALHDILSKCYVTKSQEISNKRLLGCILLGTILLFSQTLLEDNSTKGLSQSSFTVQSFPSPSAPKKSISVNPKPNLLSSNTIYGSVRGDSFHPLIVEYSPKMKNITFKSDNSFFPKSSVTIFLFEKDKAEARKFVYYDETSTGSKPHIHIATKAPGKTLPDTKIYTEGYKLSLRFTAVDDNKVDAVISLALPKERVDFSGNFSSSIRE